MVKESLHVICGNCGRNDMMKFEIDLNEDTMENDVYILCSNCCTLNNLEDTIPRK
jgi:hypothetical protein